MFDRKTRERYTYARNDGVKANEWRTSWVRLSHDFFIFHCSWARFFQKQPYKEVSWYGQR